MMFHGRPVDEQPKRKSPRTEAKLLRTRVCLDYALYLSERPNLHAMAKADLGLSSPLDVYRWKHNQTMYLGTAVSVYAKFPRVVDLFTSPLFAFLDDPKLNARAIRKMLAPYRDLKSDLWRFPNDEELNDEHRWTYTYGDHNSEMLVARADIYGFMAITGLVRLAEAMADDLWHLFHTKNMYAALPAVVRLPWFKNHYDLLRRCVTKLHHRVATSARNLEVKWDVIERQIEAPVHEPCRELRPRDPITLRFVGLESPVIFHEDDALRHLLVSTLSEILQ